MIRKLVARRRFQNAATSSHRFMAQCNHLGEPMEAHEPALLPAQRLGPTSAQVKELLKARRARATFFGAHLFTDPAWDILLLAYLAVLEGESLLVSTLLRTSLIPATTTLRWVKALEQDGWLEHMDEPIEAPSSSLKLSAAGRAGMQAYLAGVWPSLPL